jgi:parallel beta-helix repeat protein
MRNINVWATPGHGFFLGGDSEYNLCKNIKITLHPSGDKRRVITTCADHFGAINCLGNIKLEDCEFGYGADDCINFHDKTMMGMVNSPNSIICRVRYANVGDLIEFRKMNYAPTGKTLKVVKQNKFSDGKYEMFFDGNLPVGKGERLLMFNRSHHSDNMIVRNCYFHHNRAHGIIAQSSNITIENCKFERNEMGAMKIVSGYQMAGWSEGYGVDNVVVRNCEFVKPNPLPTTILSTP